MWRKANRLAGAQLKHCKERGEWAELYFMMMAAGLGMQSLQALRRFRKIRRRSRKPHSREQYPREPQEREPRPSPTRPGKVHHLQAPRRRLQPQRNGTATQKVSTRHSRLLRHPADPHPRLVHNPFDVIGRKTAASTSPRQQAPEIRPLPRSLAPAATQPRPDHPSQQRRPIPGRKSAKRMTPPQNPVIPSGERSSAKRMILRSRGTCCLSTPPQTRVAHPSRTLRRVGFHSPSL